ncbi:MAG: 4-alpha-glucanotransferase [Vampirovibrionales bacterium]
MMHASSVDLSPQAVASTTEASTTLSPLQQLALAHGLLLGFTDAFGHTQHTPDVALKRVLQCLGVAATHLENDVECQKSLERLEREQWEEPVPPVVVWHDGQPQRLRIQLNFQPSQPLTWQLTQEDGTMQQGSMTLSELNGTAQRHFAKRGPFGSPADFKAWQIDLGCPLPHGYHQLRLFYQQQELATVSVIQTPTQAFVPEAVEANPSNWGVVTQLYSLPSDTNWGIGDTVEAHRLVEWSAKQGASFVGLNPLHESFPHLPQDCSPYSPSSRLFFNWLYLHLPAVDEFKTSSEAQALWQTDEIQALVAQLRQQPMVDYPAVAQLKKRFLKLCFAEFKLVHWGTHTPRGNAYKAYCQQQGEALIRLAQYQALCDYFIAQDQWQWGWPAWPEAFQNIQSPQVQALCLTLQEEIQFYCYVQFLLHEQLNQLQQHAKEAKLAVGLYLDLAVGTSLGSADIWSQPELYALDASLGCPPDIFNQLGQTWGLPPMLPRQLRQQAYRPFIQLVQSLMQYAGAIRIDHAVALFRTFWVPNGCTGKEGAFVTQPFEDFLGILALESQRNQCLIIAEDLGTVPNEVKEAFLAWKLFSYRVFSFERGEDGRYLPPSAYPTYALTAVGTHDTPTLQGFWLGQDIDTRAALSLFASPEAEAQERANRPRERQQLLDALIHNGLMPEGVSHNEADYPETLPWPLVKACHQFLALSPSKLQALQLEDVLGMHEQMNLPGTTTQHPNWQRKLTCSHLEEALALIPNRLL